MKRLAAMLFWWCVLALVANFFCSINSDPVGKAEILVFFTVLSAVGLPELISAVHDEPLGSTRPFIYTAGTALFLILFGLTLPLFP